MPESKDDFQSTLKSDLVRVDAHAVGAADYEELPELTEDLLARAVVRLNGRAVVTLKLSDDVVERWRATGPGWQRRMAERLSRGPADAA